MKSVLGFIYFRYLLKKDRTESFGRSTIVWFGLLLLIIFSAVIWLGDVIKESNQEVQNQIAQRYSGAIPEAHPYLAEVMRQSNLRVLAAIIILVGHLQTKTGFYGKWSILLRICGA